MGPVEFILLAVVGLVAWCVASEGAWGAALTCLCVLFSGLLATNFFEPLANLMEKTFATVSPWSERLDIIALVGLFALIVFLLRTACAYLVPTYLTVRPLVHDVVRWSASGLTGYVTMAFLLTALHTAPLPREFLGFTPERSNFLGITKPDRQWLGFTQYVSEKPFVRWGQGRIFDGPRIKFGEVEGVWPSFPIRYASRRSQAARGVERPVGNELKRVKRKPQRRDIRRDDDDEEPDLGF
jgi:hypothetical protein